MTHRKQITISVVVFTALLSCATQIHAVVQSESTDFINIKKLFNDGLYDLSLDKLESFIKNNPQTPHLYQAHLLLGRAYYKQNSFAKALYEFQTILNSPAASEYQDEALYWSGDVYMKTGDYKSALECYERMIGEFPASRYLSYALYSKGWAYYKLDLFDEAVKCFQEVVSRYPVDKISMEAGFRSAECQYLSGRYEKAEYELEKFIASYPLSDMTPEALYLQGESKYCLGKYRESITPFDRALSISPKARWAALAVYRVGMAYRYLGEYAQSIAELNRCIAMETSEAVRSRAMLGLALNYERSSSSDAALNICDKIIEEYPYDTILPDVYCCKARLLTGMKRYKDAEGICREAILKFSDNPQALCRIRYELGIIYAREDLYEDAVKELATVEKLSKDMDLSASSLCKIGDIFFERNDLQKAASNYDAALNRYPDSACADYAQYRIAEISDRTGKRDQAILAYRALIVNFPQSRLRQDASLGLGRAYFNNGDFTRASGEFERFIEKFPDAASLPSAKFGLANALYGMSKYEPALGIFRELERSAKDEKIRTMAAYQTGWCLYNLRKDAEAVAAFETFLRNYSASDLAGDAKFWFGEYYRSKYKYDKAVEYFESVAGSPVASEKLKVESLMQIADMLREEGKSAESVAKLLELSGKFSDSNMTRKAFIKIANIKKENKDFSGAIEYYSKALTGANTEANAQLQYEIAEAYEAKEDLVRAAEEYLNVPKRYSLGLFWSVRAELKCAQLLEKMGRPDDALKLYEKLSGMEIEESAFAKKRIEVIISGKNK